MTFHNSSVWALAADFSASVTAPSFAITSISVEGTNLVLNVVVPTGLQQMVLETHSELNGIWRPAGILEVPAGGGEMAFVIPKPSTPTAFFRLKASPGTSQSPLISTELQYVTLPSLGTNLDEHGNALFHFKGQVDGSDKIIIRREGALWNHVNWDWPPEPVAVNGTQWNSKEKNYLTTVGALKFLPESFSLTSVDLETIQGRDVIALERAENALIVYLDDTPGGADTYEFKLHFHQVAKKSVHPSASTKATLKIAARIDGSDCLKITAAEAIWDHKTWTYPARATLNGIAWNPQFQSVLKNAGTNQFLPAGIDFSTARIASRKGRDLATMWADKDALWVHFADNPGGDDAYELEIKFGL